MRTLRIDPLDSFKKYKGGYNITSKHYWSSTIYTGRYGYILGTIWLLSGFVYACILAVARRTCLLKKERKQKILPLSKRHLVWVTLLGILFTCLAIVASGLVLDGCSKFHSRVQSVKNIIVETSEEASQTIFDVIKAVDDMESVTPQYGSLGGSSYLNSTLQNLNDEAVNMPRKAEKSMGMVNRAINILRMVTIIIIVLNLVVILTVLVLRSLRLRLRLHQTFCLVIIICWLLAFILWIFFGLYFFLFEFSGDTCAAFEEYQQNPQNSTLSSILQCSEQLSANIFLHDIRQRIHDTIDQVSANISAVKSLSLVCNPFSGPPEYSYQPGNCSSNTIKIGDVPQVLKEHTCSDDSGTCSHGNFLSSIAYTRVQVYASSMQNILDGFPRMERLANCQLVRDAFSKILVENCKPLKDNAHLTSTTMAVLSAIMVALALLLISEAHYHDGSHSSAVSVRPQPISAESHIGPQVTCSKNGGSDP
ncbi:uncharacterized protein LOC122050965 isoform X2 [Zingiber officinale]|nr:uncharacterized protein LOC122050965 isoform X2 [Zingiber officinale]XP_042467819.1 uncharacterized protein LOC122050965 isoform X2 [Zingiber officinale]XP_042467826.1 uncharacterized protein LOC122050965 isoform X2 [Zingiber officinale]XP_042467833.1 uncharacterized protein LOC122050965 isoform X2 [Zingiber officinale]